MEKFPALPVDHTAFQSIDSPQKAYILGFLLADGCVLDPRPKYYQGARVNLRILAGDIQACRMAQQIAGGNLRFIEGGYRAIWEVTSDAIAADLAALGITPRKTLTAALNWDLVPARLHGAVLAGLIDGDGHQRFNKTARRTGISVVTASAVLKDQLLERFPFFTLSITPPKPRRRQLYTVLAGNRALLAALIKTVYANLPFPILERKQAVLDQLRSYLENLDAYDDRLGQVAAMKAAGFTINEIASQMGTSRRPVLARLKAEGIDSRRLVFTAEDRQEMRRMHEWGMSVLQIHAAINKGTEQAVRYHLQKMGSVGRRKGAGSQDRHPDADAILTAFHSGMTANAIASERCMDARVVCRVLHQEGISLHRGSAQKLTDDQVRWAVEQLEKGRTLRSVASELGVSGTLIRIRRKQLRASQVERTACSQPKWNAHRANDNC